MYKVEIGDKKFNIDLKGNMLLINDRPQTLDITQVGTKSYHLLLDQKSYNLELVSISDKSNEVLVKVNNRVVKVIVKTALDELLKKMGINSNSSVTKDIGAPMPGLILDIIVNEGDEVKKGDKLLILEAMKMENIIKSERDGKIKSITVAKGDSVDSGQKLIHFE